jgi:hypothetical protein
LIFADQDISAPHLPHPRRNVRPLETSGRPRAVSNFWRPNPTFKKIKHLLRDETAPRREQMRVPVSMLLGPEEPQRLNQMEMQFRPRDRDTEYPALFFDLFRGTGCHV